MTTKYLYGLFVTVIWNAFSTTFTNCFARLNGVFNIAFLTKNETTHPLNPRIETSVTIGKNNIIVKAF